MMLTEVRLGEGERERKEEKRSRCLYSPLGTVLDALCGHICGLLVTNLQRF
jgi:hypothetical protein